MPFPFKKTRSALLVLCISAAATGVASAAQVNDDGPLYYLNIQTIAPQTRDAFITAMRNNATQSRKEDANREFDVAEPGGSDPTLVLFESWRDRAGYQQHEASQHVAPVLALVPTSFAKPERKYFLQNVPGLPAPERPNVTNPNPTHNVVARLEVTDAQHSAFVDAAATAIEQARHQPGNLAFNVYQQRDDLNAFVIYERWADDKAYQQHQAQPATQAFHNVVTAALAQQPEVLVLHDRILK